MKYEVLMTIQRDRVKIVPFLMTIPQSCPFAPASISNGRARRAEKMRVSSAPPPSKSRNKTQKNRALLAAGERRRPLQSLFWRPDGETRRDERERGRPEKQSRGIKGAREGGRTQPRMRKHEGKGRADWQCSGRQRNAAFAQNNKTC